MKYIVVEFPSETDIASIALGTAIEIGTAKGTVFAKVDAVNSAPALLPHVHSVEGATGPAIPH